MFIYQSIINGHKINYRIKDILFKRKETILIYNGY